MKEIKIEKGKADCSFFQPVYMSSIAGGLAICRGMDMFEKYMIVDEECKNVIEDGKITGFQIGVRVTYYRGIIIGIIKNFEVTVDGKTYTKDDMEFAFNGNTYTFDAMYGVTEERWGFGDTAILTVKKEGGLSAGEHEVEVLEELRVSYGLMPEYHPNVARWKKMIVF